MNKTAEEIRVRINAGYRLVGVETRDDTAALAAIEKVAKETGRALSLYTHAHKASEGDNPFAPQECVTRLVAFLDDECDRIGEDRFVVIRDVDGELGNGMVVAWIKKIVEEGNEKTGRPVVFVVGRTVRFGPALADLGCVVDVALPCDAEIAATVKRFAALNGYKMAAARLRRIVNTLRGVPGCRIPHLLGTAFARKGELRATDVLAEKTAMLRKDGLLEPVDLSPFDGEVGGMRDLRGYITHVSRILGNQAEAVEFGVDVPKGILIAGMPGCGKSLAVKMAARVFELPLLRMDPGRLMGKYVGESERNLREALSIAESYSPCVLWIDEIEKAFAGVGRDSDNGVATRLFGGFLTWMNERTSPVYTIATANDICGLPPELMRRGRFDELFYVDFPNASAAEEIIKGQLKRRRHVLPNDVVEKLAAEAAARGFSGADLEGAVKTGVEVAFEEWLKGSRSKRGVEAVDIEWAMRTSKSTRESMGPKVAELQRRLAEFRLTPAACQEEGRQHGKL